MTNIAALKTTPKHGSEEKASLVFIADSMSSQVEIRQKVDDGQKLYQVGDFLLMGTGYAHITQIANQQLLDNVANLNSVKDVATQLSSFLETADLKGAGGHGFIVGGPQKNELTLAQVTAQIQPRKKPNVVNIHQNWLLTAGSGSTFANQYISNISKGGKPIISSTPTQGIANLYDLAMMGAKDAGVNENMQFGIIGANGVSRLYHPSVRINQAEGYVSYLEELTGKSFSREFIDLTTNSPTENSERIDESFSRGKVRQFLGTFYDCLTHDLASNQTEKVCYTSVTEYLHAGIVDERSFTEARTSRKLAESNLEQGVSALVNRNFTEMADYVNSYHTRFKDVVKDISNMK